MAYSTADENSLSNNDCRNVTLSNASKRKEEPKEIIILKNAKGVPSVEMVFTGKKDKSELDAFLSETLLEQYKKSLLSGNTI